MHRRMGSLLRIAREPSLDRVSTSTVSSGSSSAPSSPVSATADVSLNDATRKIWQLNIGELSVHYDLLRIVSKLHIRGRQSETLFLGNEEDPPIVAVRRLLVVLANSMALGDSVAALQELYDNIVNRGEGDVGQQLLLFFKSPLFQAVPRLVQVFKFLTLDVVAPAVFKLRSHIYDSYPYRDLPGSYVCYLSIVNDEEISIVHCKSERSIDQTPENAFEFSWKYSIVFLPLSLKDMIQSSVIITSFDFNDQMPLATRRTVKNTLGAFIDDLNSYQLIWDRPLRRQPVHKDLPRLLPKINLCNEKNEQLFICDDTVPIEREVLRFLKVLGESLDDETTEELVSRFPDYVTKEGGDLSEMLLKLTLSGACVESSKLSRVLKCISQELLYPAVMTLRVNLYEKYPFKDVKGGWSININATPNGCRVIHQKREQSYSIVDEERFEFTWVLTCQLKFIDITAPNAFAADLKITDYDFSTKTTPEIRRVVIDSLYSYLDESSMFQRIWKRPLSKHPLHDDIFRFLRKDAFSLVDQDTGKTIITYDGSGSQIEQLKSFLVQISTRLGETEVLNHLQSEFDNHFKPNVPLNEQLKVFLQVGWLPESCKTISLLKCLASEMYFPAYLKLRKVLYSLFPFTDVKGSGSAAIAFSTSQNLITVRLSKKETNTSTFPGSYFQFQWTLSLQFDMEMKWRGSNIQIVDVSFKDTHSDVKAILLDTCAPFLAEEVRAETAATRKTAAQSSVAMRHARRGSALTGSDPNGTTKSSKRKFFSVRR